MLTEFQPLGARRRVGLAAILARRWFDDPVGLARSPTNGVFVALIARHGADLAVLAESVGAPLLFEAAFVGGTPAVKMLREAMVGDEARLLAETLNGTFNYGLARMERSGFAFEAVLSEAQSLGYVEADPPSDVDGSRWEPSDRPWSGSIFGCSCATSPA